MSFFKRLKQGLTKTRETFTAHLDSLIAGRKVDEALIEELEALLITSDFGLETTEAILDEARSHIKRKQRNDADFFRETLRNIIRDRLLANQTPEPLPTDKPHVMLVVGVNGVGKTTTIGKLAAHFQQRGEKVLLAAGDTFRAAAVAQLQRWGERAGCPVISQGQNADSASVVFDAYQAARSRGMDRVIADTAGRLHTKVNLMGELAKIKRVLGLQNTAAPHETLLVLDATTGQNALSQVRHFHEAVGLTGLIVTKLDGTAKGGVIVGLGERHPLPIRYIGVGEGVEDLKPFEPDPFVNALFG